MSIQQAVNIPLPPDSRELGRRLRCHLVTGRPAGVDVPRGEARVRYEYGDSVENK